MLGGFVGRTIGHLLPSSEDPALSAGFITSLVCAITLVSIYLVIAKPRRHARPPLERSVSEVAEPRGGKGASLRARRWFGSRLSRRAANVSS